MDPWTQEVVLGMTQLYQLMVEMRLWDEGWKPIDYAPHPSEHCINVELAKRYNLSSEAIELLQALPYVNNTFGNKWNFGASSNDFVLSGEPLDLRIDQEFVQSRDPFYVGVDPLDTSIGFDDVDGQYMQPWYIALNSLGNHGAVMILNMKKKNMWILGEYNDQADPALQATPKILVDDSVHNQNAIEKFASRPATEMLQDFINRFKTLEWIPGGIDEHSPRYEDYQRLYIENGWPENFDGPGFDRAREQYETDFQRQYKAEEPYNVVRHYEKYLKGRRAYPLKKQLKQLEKQAASDEWRQSFADPEGWKTVYQERKRTLQQELDDQDEMLEQMRLEAEVAKKQIEELPEEVKRRREERIRKFGY